MASRARSDPHGGQPVLAAGEPLASARAALVLLHGRGASAESILSLAEDIGQPLFAYLAPQAAGYTWYPQPFTAPLDANEPYLSSALALVESVIRQVVHAGIPAERVVLTGFSQGACLALEFAARHARRYGGVLGFSGGLIGPDGTPRDYAGSLEGTPVFIGCGDRDAHIPVPRVQHSAEVLASLDGAVTHRIYPGMGHAINDDELAFASDLVSTLLS
ncbi:MAG: phospholipase [Chloroflexi bacterium]|nr:phospholipase [Chloroflexota bacterium]